jgi:hypothetical protein
MKDILVKSSSPSPTEMTLYDYASLQRDMQQRYIGMMTELTGVGKGKTKKQELLLDEIKRIEIWLRQNNEEIIKSKNIVFESNITVSEYSKSIAK